MKVLIKMDQGGWQFWPKSEAEALTSPTLWGDQGDLQACVNSVEISDQLMHRYLKVSAEYYELQELFEHQYRHQQGLAPYKGSPYKEKENV